MASHASHILLYLLTFAMPLIGWALVSASGNPVTIIGSWAPRYCTKTCRALCRCASRSPLSGISALSDCVATPGGGPFPLPDSARWRTGIHDHWTETRCVTDRPGYRKFPVRLAKRQLKRHHRKFHRGVYHTCVLSEAAKLAIVSHECTSRGKVAKLPYGSPPCAVGDK